MDHQTRVQALQASVRSRPDSKLITVRKKRPGHTPHDYQYKLGKYSVDVTQLSHILEIDPVEQLAVVEGEVNMGELCAATLPHGLVPAVVPELETFTVAGLINGLGLETSSHKHGIFPMNVPWFELVLGNGELLHVDAQQHADLFTTVPGCYGSLGILTRAAVQLVPAKPFVRSRYKHFGDVSEYVRAYGAALDEHDFVEGFVMGPDSHVLIYGDFSDAMPALSTFHALQPGNLWYYEHAERQARREAEDLVPTYEYLFRHMRSLLWVSRFANFLHLPMTRLGRWLIDRRVLDELRRFGLTSGIPHEARERSVVMQDVAVTLGRLEAGIEYAKQNFGVYPMWNCAASHAKRGPYAPGQPHRMLFITDHRLSERERDELEAREKYVVDIGLYGEPSVPNFRHHSAIRALQNFVDMPAVWGVCYLTRAEFERHWDIETYDKVRDRYHATNVFPHIADKVLSPPLQQEEQGPDPFWRFAAFFYRFRNPGRGI